MNRHLPLVQRVHPMLPGGGGEETVCAHCHEVWPCTVTVLLQAAKEAIHTLNGMPADMRAVPGVSKHLRAAIVKAEGR